MSFSKEDTVVARKAPNALGAYLNATYRAKEAELQHPEFFNSKKHNDRVDEVIEILVAFFDRNPSYITPRGVRRSTPFENVKMQDVGRQLSRIARDTKWYRLYAPLMALGDVDVISANGHLLVRVFPVGKMPKRASKQSVFAWYPEKTTA